jgi:hypothetical protein
LKAPDPGGVGLATHWKILLFERGASDGAFFYSSTAVNPALTIIANALCVGEHLIPRLA